MSKTWTSCSMPFVSIQNTLITVVFLIENYAYQVAGPQHANRERTLVLSKSIAFRLTHVRVVRPRPHVLWSDALLNMKPESKTEKASETTPIQIAHATHRNMHDSYCEVTLPFKSSKEFLEQYTNASGGIRTGKIMEVLDSTAGSVAYKHILGPEAETVGTIQEQGFYVVTASVDRWEKTQLSFHYLMRHLQGWTCSLQYILPCETSGCPAT